MLKILVAGGFDAKDPRLADIEKFCAAMGAAIVGQGHLFLNGCRTELDRLIAEAAYAKLKQLDEKDPDRRIVSYINANQKPAHELGTIIRSRLVDWEINKAQLYVPEHIAMADVVIVVGGFNGTFRAANWARIARKPLLPVTAFGGAAAEIFQQEMNEFERLYGGRLEAIEYQELNSIKTNWVERAARIVSLAEKVSASTLVTVIMSYSEDEALQDAYESFKEVCAAAPFRYRCSRVEDKNTGGRIVPAIMKQIEQSAFVIADLSELKQNVFYELGYAEGLKKPVIVTAKVGTELPFDVKDVPTIFWGSQTKLKEALREKISMIASTQGR